MRLYQMPENAPIEDDKELQEMYVILFIFSAHICARNLSWTVYLLSGCTRCHVLHVTHTPRFCGQG